MSEKRIETQVPVGLAVVQQPQSAGSGSGQKSGGIPPLAFVVVGLVLVVVALSGGLTLEQPAEPAAVAVVMPSTTWVAAAIAPQLGMAPEELLVEQVEGIPEADSNEVVFTAKLEVDGRLVLDQPLGVLRQVEATVDFGQERVQEWDLQVEEGAAAPPAGETQTGQPWQPAFSQVVPPSGSSVVVPPLEGVCIPTVKGEDQAVPVYEIDDWPPQSVKLYFQYRAPDGTVGYFVCRPLAWSKWWVPCALVPPGISPWE